MSNVCFVGAAKSNSAILPGATDESIHMDVATRALKAAGLTFNDVDGYATVTQDWMRMPGLYMAEVLGIRPRWLETTSIGGASFLTHAIRAREALAAGRVDCVLITYGGATYSTAGNALGTTARSASPLAAALEEPTGLSIVSAYALAASAHQARYGTTSEDLAHITVAAREWAARNPGAMYRELIGVDDVVSSPLIADPLHRLDCCVVSDGGGAVVMTREEDARALGVDPVWFLGAGESVGTQHISSMPDLTTSPAARSAAAAYAESGTQPADMSLAMLYDSFTITALLQLEDCGFCAKGEVGRFVREVGIGVDGGLPVNTDGGGLSAMHPGMRGMFLLVEAIQQLTRSAPGGQVANAELAFVNGIGGWLSSSVSLILGNDRGGAS